VFSALPRITSASHAGAVVARGKASHLECTPVPELWVISGGRRELSAGNRSRCARAGRDLTEVGGRVHIPRHMTSRGFTASFLVLSALSSGRSELDETTLLAPNPDAAPPGPFGQDDAAAMDSGQGDPCTETCAGFCAPGGCVVSLASSPSPGDLTVDSENIYWTDTSLSTVEKIGVAGGTPTMLASEFAPYAIAVDSQNVYFGTVSAIMKVPLGGGTPSTLAPAWDANDIAVDATNVYWTNFDGTVDAIAKGGGNSVTLLNAGEGQDSSRGIAVDATNVYWGSASGVMTIPLAGGTATTLALFEGGADEIAIDTANVYFTQFNTNVLQSVELGGGVPKTLATPSALAINGMAIDSGNVYFTVDSALMKVPLGGGAPTTLVSDQSNLSNIDGAIATDGRSVYWATGTSLEGSAGSLRKVTPTCACP
jgi:hypothetical protein